MRILLPIEPEPKPPTTDAADAPPFASPVPNAPSPVLHYTSMAATAAGCEHNGSSAERAWLTLAVCAKGHH